MSGVLHHPPSDVIQQLLIDLAQASLVGDAEAWPVYALQMPDTPEDCVCVYDTEGVLDGTVMNDGTECEHYGIQIRVRSEGAVDGYVKATQIKRALDRGVNRNTVTLDVDDYTVHAVKRTSGVLPIGMDPGSRRRNWTINAIVALTMDGVGTGS